MTNKIFITTQKNDSHPLKRDYFLDGIKRSKNLNEIKAVLDKYNQDYVINIRKVDSKKEGIVKLQGKVESLDIADYVYYTEMTVKDDKVKEIEEYFAIKDPDFSVIMAVIFNHTDMSTNKDIIDYMLNLEFDELAGNDFSGF